MRKTLAIILAALFVFGSLSVDARRKKARRSHRTHTSSVVVVTDSTGHVRAMVPYTGAPQSGRPYAEAVSSYARQLADADVHVYTLVAPGQEEFYLPHNIAPAVTEKSIIRQYAGYLDPLVTPVFVADTLRSHVAEHIYSRTDHHWAPLGAYYAAAKFADVAGVDFTPLSAYTTDTVRNYVGTMAARSHNAAVSRSPENFIYYKPPTGYVAEFVDYTASGRLSGSSTPHREEFFKHYPDGSKAAYCVFMGGDNHTVKVSHTGAKPGRRLLIVKDSFGNAMVPCLFGSFEEVHVTDFRYYPGSLLKYISDNNITDLLFVNTISIAFDPKTASRLLALQSGAPMHRAVKAKGKKHSSTKWKSKRKKKKKR